MDIAASQAAARQRDEVGVNQKNMWELRGRRMEQENAVESRIEEFRKRRLDEVARRRELLRDFLNEEAMQLNEELAATVETTASRKANMLARARELKAKREAERSELAAQKEHERWRSQNYAFKEMDNRLALDKVLDVRGSQLAEQEAQRQAAKAEDQAYADYVRKQDAKDFETQDREERERLARNAKELAERRTQMEEVAAIRRQEVAALEREGQLLRQAAIQRAEEDLRAAEELQVQKRRERAMYAADNQERIRERQEREERDLAEDRERLKLLKEADERAKAAELEKHERQKQQLLNQREMLRQQQLENRSLEKREDEVIADAFEREWDRRDAERNARAKWQAALDEDVAAFHAAEKASQAERARLAREREEVEFRERIATEQARIEEEKVRLERSRAQKSSYANALQDQLVTKQQKQLDELRQENARFEREQKEWDANQQRAKDEVARGGRLPSYNRRRVDFN